jgi:hypothetical protein
MGRNTSQHHGCRLSTCPFSGCGKRIPLNTMVAHKRICPQRTQPLPQSKKTAPPKRPQQPKQSALTAALINASEKAEISTTVRTEIAEIVVGAGAVAGASHKRSEKSSRMTQSASQACDQNGIRTVRTIGTLTTVRSSTSAPAGLETIRSGFNTPAAGGGHSQGLGDLPVRGNRTVQLVKRSSCASNQPAQQKFLSSYAHARPGAHKQRAVVESRLGFGSSAGARLGVSQRRRNRFGT